MKIHLGPLVEKDGFFYLLWPFLQEYEIANGSTVQRPLHVKSGKITSDNQAKYKEGTVQTSAATFTQVIPIPTLAQKEVPTIKGLLHHPHSGHEWKGTENTWVSHQDLVSAPSSSTTLKHTCTRPYWTPKSWRTQDFISFTC